ncbi:two-component response regulator ARR14-like [Corylus avellana]|uniref:two-component response regulator ARR14-like n=1 Tax=Corylus avellana TaxID=13451 RepID=UPI00286B533A|nr:two-component response regulator ARR14-like [Corylus avellana]XP_059456680.1 two-component response regulator ARR14-like [Corylus avellana]
MHERWRALSRLGTEQGLFSFNSMNSEKAISIESMINASPLPEAVSVLVVDGNSSCLAIISKMLYKFGYKVLIAKRATVALSIVREKEDDLHLVLAEAHLPDMDKYEFLERMGEMSKLPVVLMSADDNENAMLGSLFKGAMFYLVKPVTLNNVRNLWQFASMKSREETAATDGVSSVQGETSDIEIQSFENKMQQSHQKAKRKVPEAMEKDEEEDNDDSTVIKKPKLIWTNDLHNRFLEAIRVLGIDGAHPKKILQHMKVQGLKKENISSHLQKYRLFLKREQDAIQKTMTRDTTGSSMASNQQAPFNLQGFLQFSNHQSPVTSYQLESSCSDISNPLYGQLMEPRNQLDSTYPNSGLVGIWITSNDLAGFGQTGNSNGEEILRGDTDPFSVDSIGFGNATHCLTLLSDSL